MARPHPRREEAIAELAAGADPKEIARRYSVHRDTVKRWRARGVSGQERSRPPTGPETAAALMLAKGQRKRRIAEELDVSPETVARWCGEPRFKKMVEEHRLAIREGFIDRIWALVDPSIDAVKDIIGDSDARDSDRIAAIKLVLSYAVGTPTSKIEHSGPDGAPVEVQHVFDPTALAKLPEHELARLLAATEDEDVIDADFDEVSDNGVEGS